MTKRSMSALRKQFQEAYNKGWNAGITSMWNQLLMPQGVTMKNGDNARAVIRSKECREMIAEDIGILIEGGDRHEDPTP